MPGGDCRPHPLQEWGKAKGAGAGGLQGPRPSSANQQRPAASWRASGVGGEADGRVSVAPQPRRRQGGLGGVPLLPAPEDTALPHPPVGQCRPGHPLSPSAAGGATLPVDPPPLCSTVTPQATPSSWLQQSLSAQSSPHAGPHPEPSPVSLAPLDTPVPQNKSSSLGLTRPCPHGGRWRPSSERPSALSGGNPSPSPPASPPPPAPPRPPTPWACRWEEGSYGLPRHPDPTCPLPPARPRGGGARPSLGEVSARDPMLPHHSGPPSSLGPPSESRPQLCPPLGLRKPWGPQSSSPALEPQVAGCLLPSGAVPTLHCRNHTSLPCPEPHHPLPPGTGVPPRFLELWLPTCPHPALGVSLACAWSTRPGQEQEGWPRFPPLLAS